MSEIWLRKIKLSIQIDQGNPEALDLSEFKINFHIGQATAETPKAAEIYIYNLSDETMNKLAGSDSEKKDTIVTLEVGYRDTPLETLFKGQVFQFRRGRDNQVDRWLCVLAQSGDHLKNFAVVSRGVPAGTSINNTGKILIAEAENHGVTAGEIPVLSDQKYPRGRVFFGSLYSHMGQFYTENDVFIDMDDGILNANTYVGYRTEPVIILNRDSGMIGMPQMTTEGLKVACAINPKIKRGGRIQVDTTNLQTEAYDIDFDRQGKDQVFKNPNTTTNKAGLFIVQSIESIGDTRGEDWYHNLVCTAIGATVPKSGVSIKGVD